MKKYLLLFLMCVYASIGAWAEDGNWPLAQGGSVTISGSTYTINSSESNEFATWFSSINYNGAAPNQEQLTNGISKIVVNGPLGENDFNYLGWANNNAILMDLSSVTTGADLIKSKLGINNCNKLLPSGIDISSGFSYPSWVAIANNNGTTEILVLSSGGLTTALSEIGNDLQSYLKIYGDIYEADKTSLTNLTSISTLELSGVTIHDQNGNSGGTLDLSSVTYSYSSNSTITSGTVTPPPSHDPYTIIGDAVTINMNYISPTYSDLSGALTAAVSELGGTTIGSLTVTGDIDDTILAALNGTDLSSATRIDLSGATVASGSSIDNITLPSSLEELVLPKGILTISDALKSKFAQATNLWYAYSPTSQEQTIAAQTTSPDLVWVNQAGGLDKAIINEAKLRTAIYVKVESAVALNDDDVDLATNNKQTGENTYENVSLDNTSTDATNYAWQYIDMSGANLQNDVIVKYKAPQTTNSYRLILPDGWDPNRMSIIPSLGDSKYGSGLAAVYSYRAQGFLQILEINDTQYKPGALTDNRIVRGGTKAVRVVSGEYNGTTYGVFGQLQADATKNNLFAAINGAAPSIEAVTITDVRTATNEPLTFTNENLIYIQLDRVKSMYNQELKTDGPIINVDGCTKLQTLNLLNSVFASVDASVPALAASGDDPSTTGLTSVDMSGTTVVGTTDLSTSPITNTGFVTNDDTWFKGDLNLSKTALTTFTTTAKVGTTTDYTGNIILNENELTNVSLNQVQFQNSNSKIYVRKSSDSNNSDYGVLTGSLNANETIIVPQDFDAEHRIVPYVAASIKKEAYVPPVVSYENTDMHLHEAETSGETPDKYVYWYTGENIENGIATIRAEGSIQATLLSDAYIKNKTFVKVKIKGYISPTSLGDIGNISTQVLDLSELDLTHADGCSISDLKEWFCKTYWDLNSSVKFLILPSSATQQTLVARDHLSGLKDIYCAIALSDYDTNNNFDFVAYNKVAGTLQPAVIAAGRGTINGSTMIRGGRTAYYPTMSGNSNRSAVISGNINAYDLSCNSKLSADGHLSFNKRYANEALLTDDRTNTGTETNIAGAFSGSNGPKTLDLKYVDIAGDEYINDICISYLVPTNYLKYLTIPETSSVKETPSYFIQHNLVKEICIPSNIEVIRTHFAPSVDHVWTTGYKVGQTGGDINNMRYDNGAWETASTTTPAYGYSNYTFGANSLYPHGTYTFSSNLKMIESNAFSNTTPHVRDVYVLAKKAPECHVDAFCTAMYIGNSGFAPSIVDGVITRDSYVNGSNWIAMLHYPRECLSPEVQRYTDPTRNYSVASNEVDGRGGVLYYPSYGEFLAAYAQGTTGYLWNAWDRTYEFGMLKSSLSIGNTGWTLKNQQDANAKFLANPDLTKFPDDTKYTCTSFYDVTAGGKEDQPSGLVPYYNVRWNEKVLSNNGDGVQLYPQANTSNTEFSFNVNTNGTEDNTSDDTKVTSRDYRGWHQFVLNAYAANTDIPMQPSRSYQTDNDWWTICLPYSLTYNEVMLYYGDVADDGTIKDATKVPIVCLLSNVIRDKANDHITLNFSSNLMTHKATRTGGEWVVSDTAPNQYVAKDTEHDGTADIIIHAGVPYMIKPYFSTGAKRVFDVYAPGQTPSTSLSDGRIRVSATDYPGLYEKLKHAENVAGENFRKVQEDSLYTVPALILKENAASSGENYDSSEEITYNSKTYYRSTDYDYTFVGALQKNIIPPFSYFLGYKKKSLFVYADYLTTEFEANKKATTPDYKNTMKWTNNSCVICPNFLGSSCKSTQADSYNKYNLKKGSHNGLVTQASGTGDQTRPAQWIIYGTSGTDMTAILADDRFQTSGAGSAKGIFASSGLDINYGYDMEFSTVTAINGVQDNSTQEKVKDGKVYTIDGRYAGDSLESLNKGVYIMNGKKFIVK